MSQNNQTTKIIDIRPNLPSGKRVHLAINSVNTSNTEMSNKLFPLLKMVLIQNLEHLDNPKFNKLPLCQYK